MSHQRPARTTGDPPPRGGGRLRRPCRLAAGLVLAAALVASACSWPLGAGHSDPRDSDVISADELENTRATNLYELIERERPRWLIKRGTRSLNLPTEIVVALNGRYYGDVESLRTFTPEGVHSISYVDGATAGTLVTGVGSRHVEAAILLEMKRW